LNEVRTTDRWLGAVCYLSVFVFVPIVLQKEKSEFLARHCRQGFVIFGLEVVLYLLLALVDTTIGLIPILGLLVSILLHLAAFGGCLALSVIGLVRALSGETWRNSWLDEFADRVPILASE